MSPRLTKEKTTTKLHATISLPLTPSAEPLPKPEAQALLHAAEELYFLRRYAEAAGFARAVLDDGAGAARVDEETRRLLRYYEGRSLARLGRKGEWGEEEEEEEGREKNEEEGGRD